MTAVNTNPYAPPTKAASPSRRFGSGFLVLAACWFVAVATSLVLFGMSGMTLALGIVAVSWFLFSRSQNPAFYPLNRHRMTVIEELTGKRAQYERVGHDHRTIGFESSRVIGEGAAECERVWHVNEVDVQPVLTISRLDRPTCHLRRGPERSSLDSTRDRIANPLAFQVCLFHALAEIRRPLENGGRIISSEVA